MTQADKELLIKDLCARLPYGVKVRTSFGGEIRNDKVQLNFAQLSLFEAGHEDVKPYLFPLSSMTEAQRKEYHNLCSVGTDECGDIIYFDTYESIDYLNKNKFDYRYLIPMRLANDATGLNIYSDVDGIISYRK